jgi:C-terminal processing protease CtpA/Prc
MRLERMDSNASALIREWMPRFRDTKALIVDMRGNGGGVRTPILELAGYLMNKADAPRIGNVAKYRLADHFPQDHLSAARYVYRATSKQFDDRQRAAVREFARSFTPQWEPPANEFSDWHYLVLSKREDDSRFDYQGRVAILMDEGCFSATDIFLGAFKSWPNVILIGQPSGGGSARSASFRLPKSGIRIRCASMASYQADGQLYDTNGITPDVTVVRPPEYYCLGDADAILQRARVALSEQ